MIQSFEEDPAIACLCLWDTVELDVDRWVVGEAALPLLVCVFKSKRSQVEGRRVERGLDADRWAVGGSRVADRWAVAALPTTIGCRRRLGRGN